MGVTVVGLDRLKNKLEAMGKVDTSKAVKDSAEEISDNIKSGASHIFPQNADHCRVIKTSKYGSNASAEIGYAGNFSEWKHMYFHNYGYQQYVFGHPTGEKTVIHIHWFTNTAHHAIEKQSKILLSDIQNEYRREMNK